MRVGRVIRRRGALHGLRRRRAEKGKQAGWAEHGEELGRIGICWATRDERKGSGFIKVWAGPRVLSWVCSGPGYKGLGKGFLSISSSILFLTQLKPNEFK